MLSDTVKLEILIAICQGSIDGVLKSMNVARQFNVDWHLVSDYLDRLHTLDVLKVVSHDASGMCMYELSN